MAESVAVRVEAIQKTSNSAMADRPRELGDFKGVGHFEAKFWVQALRFALKSMDQ